MEQVQVPCAGNNVNRKRCLSVRRTASPADISGTVGRISDLEGVNRKESERRDIG